MSPSQLRKARESLGLIPTEMARALGVSYPTYRQWESGRRSLPAIGARAVELLEMLPAGKVRQLAARDRD